MPDPACLHSHNSVWKPRYSSCSCQMQLMRIVSGEHPSEDLLHLFYTCALNEREHPGDESEVWICCTLCKQIILYVQKWVLSIVLFSRALDNSRECKLKAGPAVPRPSCSAQCITCHRCQSQRRTCSPEQNLGKLLEGDRVRDFCCVNPQFMNGSSRGEWRQDVRWWQSEDGETVLYRCGQSGSWFLRDSYQDVSLLFSVIYGPVDQGDLRTYSTTQSRATSQTYWIRGYIHFLIPGDLFARERLSGSCTSQQFPVGSSPDL